MKEFGTAKSRFIEFPFQSRQIWVLSNSKMSTDFLSRHETFFQLVKECKDFVADLTT